MVLSLNIFKLLFISLVIKHDRVINIWRVGYFLFFGESFIVRHLMDMGNLFKWILKCWIICWIWIWFLHQNLWSWGLQTVGRLADGICAILLMNFTPPRGKRWPRTCWLESLSSLSCTTFCSSISLVSHSEISVSFELNAWSPINELSFWLI